MGLDSLVWIPGFPLMGSYSWVWIPRFGVKSLDFWAWGPAFGNLGMDSLILILGLNLTDVSAQTYDSEPKATEH